MTSRIAHFKEASRELYAVKGISNPPRTNTIKTWSHPSVIEQQERERKKARDVWFMISQEVESETCNG